jgi:hypothetical protein
LLFASTLSFASSSAAAPDAALFAPPFCPYAVQFPSAIADTGAPAADGSKIAAVEQVVGGTRLSAFCAAPAVPSPAALAPAERQARIRALVNDLQISEPSINDAAPVGPDCSEVRGTMLVNAISYRIVARLCMQADSTFIAEAIFGAAGNEASAGSFIASVKRTATASNAVP